mgnify:CR=1 FL=1
MEEARKAMAGWYKDYNAPTDRKVAKRMLKIAREHMTDLPSFYTEIVDKEFNGDTDAYVDYIFDNSLFTSQEKVDELAAEMQAAINGLQPNVMPETGDTANGSTDTGSANTAAAMQTGMMLTLLAAAGVAVMILRRKRS